MKTHVNITEICTNIPSQHSVDTIATFDEQAQIRWTSALVLSKSLSQSSMNSPVHADVSNEAESCQRILLRCFGFI